MAQQEFQDFEVEGLDLENTKPMEGGSYALVDEGSYIVDVVNVKQPPDDYNGKPYIEVEFQISEGQETDQAAAFTGQRVWNRYYLTEKAKGRLVQLMKACGAPLTKFSAQAIYGQRIRLDVVHSQGEAKTDDQGNVLPPRTFANVCKERSLDGDAAEATPEPPPVTKKAETKTETKAATTTPAAQKAATPAKAANGAARRA